MRILCPFTDLRWETEFVLRLEHNNDIIWLDCNNNNEAYFNGVAKLWGEQQTFLIVEHDLLPGPGLLQKIYDCPRPICVYQMIHREDENGRLLAGVGIFKFGRDLMLRYPDHLKSYQGDRSWHLVDQILINNLVLRNPISVHVHPERVWHLKPNEFPNTELVYSKVR